MYGKNRVGKFYCFCEVKSEITSRREAQDFPGGLMVKTLPSSTGGVGLIPGWGAKIPGDSWPKNQNPKQKQYNNKFNEGFKKKKKRGSTESMRSGSVSCSVMSDSLQAHGL